jgi:hypothetical protein
MNKLITTLHDATHQVPGVPEHQDRPRDLQERADRHRHPTRMHRHTPPRVMVGWQNWIASMFTRKAD